MGLSVLKRAPENRAKPAPSRLGWALFPCLAMAYASCIFQEDEPALWIKLGTSTQTDSTILESRVVMDTLSTKIKAGFQRLEKMPSTPDSLLVDSIFQDTAIIKISYSTIEMVDIKTLEITEYQLKNTGRKRADTAIFKTPIYSVERLDSNVVLKIILEERRSSGLPQAQPPLLFPWTSLETVKSPLVYPDSLVAVIPFDSLKNLGWFPAPDTAEPALSQPLRWSWNTEEDTVKLIWRDRKDTGAGNEFGTFEGNLNWGHERGLIYPLPYRFERRFSGFAPHDTAVKMFWLTPADPKKYDRLRFTSTVEAAPDSSAQSLLQLRSRFRLKGDFSFDMHINPSGNNEAGGYTVALFVSDDANPLFKYSEIFQDKEFQVWSKAAGIFFNGSRALSRVKSLFFPDLISSLPRKFNFNNVTLRFTRKNNVIRLQVKPLAEISFQDITSLAYDGEDLSALPDQVYIHMAVGNFTGSRTAVTVDWEKFEIHEGEMVLP